MSDLGDLFRSDRPLVIGHRGERRVGPENTLEAFERAARAGADGVELDVRLARTGEVIVLHDEDLSRVTAGHDERRAEDLSLADLRRVDLGANARVPALADAIDLARSTNIMLNVEVKRDVPSRTDLVIAVAREIRRNAVVPLLLSSFDPIMIAALGALLPKVPTALLVHKSSYHDVMLRARPLTLATGMNVEHVLFSEERTPLLRRQSFVCAWTVNSANDARRVARAGARGIITDDPARILATVTGG